VIEGVKLPYEQGIYKMMEYFNQLKSSSQSQGMRYAFFAERQIARVTLVYT